VRRRPVAQLSMALLLLSATATDFQSACGCRLCRVYEWVRRTGCAAVALAFRCLVCPVQDAKWTCLFWVRVGLRVPLV
jgi:hypothetical protein